MKSKAPYRLDPELRVSGQVIFKVLRQNRAALAKHMFFCVSGKSKQIASFPFPIWMLKIEFISYWSYQFVDLQCIFKRTIILHFYHVSGQNFIFIFSEIPSTNSISFISFLHKHLPRSEKRLNPALLALLQCLFIFTAKNLFTPQDCYWCCGNL